MDWQYGEAASLFLTRSSSMDVIDHPAFGVLAMEPMVLRYVICHDLWLASSASQKPPDQIAGKVNDESVDFISQETAFVHGVK